MLYLIKGGENMNYTVTMETRKSKKGADYCVLVVKIKDFEKVILLDKNEVYILTHLLGK